ncbi:MAG: sigma-54 dependent transcriptional regulator [candidate division WOR-3 bacterium]
MIPQILLVDDNEEYLNSLAAVLGSQYLILKAHTFDTGTLLLKEKPDIALIDIRLDDTKPSNKDGIELLKYTKTYYPDIPVIIMTAYGDIQTAVEAIKLGADDFIQKDKITVWEFKNIIKRTLEKKRLEKKVKILEDELHQLEPAELIGNTPAIKEIKKIIQMISNNGEISVLITGETGVGKELVARTIHKTNPRRNGPFVALAISALTKNIVESELFGHEKGAFTGADRRKIGYLEKADTGILFLDEIGDLDPEVQVKLLRFLDTKQFCRVGGTDEIKLDVQIIAATNIDLKNAIKAGKFRPDLYYRLKTVEIYVPPLRERKDDIPLLAKYFLRQHYQKGKSRCEDIHPSAIDYLQNYHWPGNIRELKSCIERAAIYADYNQRSVINIDDLPMEIRNKNETTGYSLKVEILEQGIDISEELAKMELAYIEAALKKCGGIKSEAWKLLGYNDRFALRRRIRIIQQKFPHLLKLYSLNIRKSHLT